MSKPDTAAHNLGGKEDYYNYDSRAIINGEGFSDAVKFSQSKRCGVTFSRVFGGSEDCIDINNNCEDIRILDTDFYPRGKYLATIKGGSKNIKITGSVYSHGKEVDIDLGNWSDQSIDPPKNITIDLKSRTGKPITVRLLNVDEKEVKLINGPYKFVFPKPGFFRMFFIAVFILLRKHKIAFK